MSYQLINKFKREVWVKLSVKLTVHDFQVPQTLARLSFEQFGQFRVLVELEDFQAGAMKADGKILHFWKKREMVFLNSHLSATRTGKMKSSCFPGNRLRQTAIEFFAQDQFDQTQAWLSEENQPAR